MLVEMTGAGASRAARHVWVDVIRWWNSSCVRMLLHCFIVSSSSRSLLRKVCQSGICIKGSEPIHCKGIAIATVPDQTLSPMQAQRSAGDTLVTVCSSFCQRWHSREVKEAPRLWKSQSLHWDPAIVEVDILSIKCRRDLGECFHCSKVCKHSL